MDRDVRGKTDGDIDRSVNNRVSFVVSAIVLAWAALVISLSLKGVLSGLAIWQLAPAIALLFAFPLAVYFGNGPLKHWVSGLGLEALTLLHSWRILAAVFFFICAGLGVLPEQFARIAGCGDLLIGMLALYVTALPFRKSGYWAVHLLGLADFALAIGLGFTLAQASMVGMQSMALLPLALILLLALPLSMAAHVMALHLLWVGKEGETVKAPHSLPRHAAPRRGEVVDLRPRYAMSQAHADGAARKFARQAERA